MPPAAELVDATKKYGEVEALKGVTIRIELGEVVAMLGPNGAGKTTSISLLLGLRKPTSGKALLFGLDPTNLQSRSRVGVMLQESGVPDVLFLDEPTVGMDVEGRRSFIDRIAGFARSGRTIVLTTHYLEEADQLAERVIVIDRGLVIADAPPAVIKSRVAGKRVRFSAPAVKEKDLEGLP